LGGGRVRHGQGGHWDRRSRHVPADHHHAGAYPGGHGGHHRGVRAGGVGADFGRHGPAVAVLAVLGVRAPGLGPVRRHDRAGGRLVHRHRGRHGRARVCQGAAALCRHGPHPHLCRGAGPLRAHRLADPEHKGEQRAVQV
ncbi:hypothetical protein H4R21_003689, partial [Coemansia helicoidea]